MLQNKPRTTLAIGTLAHEADHIATCLCDQLQIGVSYTDDETHAKIVGYIVKEILEKA